MEIMILLSISLCARLNLSTLHYLFDSLQERQRDIHRGEAVGCNPVSRSVLLVRLFGSLQYHMIQGS